MTLFQDGVLDRGAEKGIRASRGNRVRRSALQRLN
jgi:hypothetical protein